MLAPLTAAGNDCRCRHGLQETGVPYGWHPRRRTPHGYVTVGARPPLFHAAGVWADTTDRRLDGYYVGLRAVAVYHYVDR